MRRAKRGGKYLMRISYIVGVAGTAAGVILGAGAPAAAEELDRFALFAACAPMRLVVERLDADATEFGLTEDAIRNAAESRLRSARLYDAQGQQVLYIAVRVHGYLARITLHYNKLLHDALTGGREYAPTWIDGSIGVYLGDTGSVVSELGLLLDRFLVEYLRVNEAACSRTVGMAAPWPPPKAIPRPKPSPPKRVAEAKSETPKDAKSKKYKFAADRIAALFDADRIAALIDRTPRKRSAPERPSKITSRTTQPLAGQPLTLSEVDFLKTQIERCWIVQAGARYAEDLVVTIRVFLNPDGSLRREPQIVDDERLAGDPFFRAAAESAIRAVLKCEPFKIPFTKYHRWREIELTFDPREILG